MSELAILFPGQGSQAVGMLSDVATEFPIVGQTFEEASDALHYNLWRITQDNPDDQLNQTEFTQPALLCASVALWRVLQSNEDIEPTVMAGHSLGEYSALVCSNAMSFTDGVQLVSKRGQFMQQAVPAGVGAMAAIIGLDNDVIAQVCEDAALGEVVTPANFNAIGQTVVAGHSAAVDRAIALATEAGAKIAKRIPVSVPSHCALMHPATEQLSAELKSIEIRQPKFPVVQNVDALDHIEVDDIAENLINQLENPVRWVETILHMIEQGVTTALECGPGKVIAGLNKRISRELNTINVGTLAGITSYLEQA